MSKRVLMFTLLVLVSVDGMETMAQSITQPPVARKITRKQIVHGENLDDDYFWLREKSNKEVISYLEAENAYTDAMIHGSEALQEKLYQEMLGRIKQTDTNVPYSQDGYFYYSRTETGKQYSIYARKKGSVTAPEEITLDLNELAVGQKYTAIGTYAVSDDANLLAYSHDTTGFREYMLRIKDLRTGNLLPEDIGKVTSAFWSDNRTLFYISIRSVSRRTRTCWCMKRKTKFIASVPAAHAAASTSSLQLQVRTTRSIATGGPMNSMNRLK
jgi:oligopeptidase B